MRLSAVLHRTALALTALALAATPGAVACSDDAAPSNAPPLAIGTLSSVSGDLTSLGQEFNDAAQLAADEINEAGGVLGRRVRLVVRDDGTTRAAARDGFIQLTSQGVPAILGPTTSEQVEAIGDLIGGSNTVTIGRTTTADKLRDLPDNGYFFRLTPADVFQSEHLANLVTRSGIEHLCLVYRRDLYGTNLAKAVQDRIKGSGTTVDVVESSYEPSSPDLSQVMPACAALLCSNQGGDAGAPDGGSSGCAAGPPEKVGLLMIAFIEDGALILDDAERRGWSANKQKFFFTDGVYDSGLLRRVKNAANLEGARGTAPAGPAPGTPAGEVFRKFADRYRTRYGREPGIFMENSFDSMYVAAIAIEIAKTATPGPAIRDAMAKVSVPGGVPVQAGDWASIRQAIADGKPIDFGGASGPVDFDEQGDIKPPYTYVVWKVEGGRLGIDARVP